MAVRDRPPKNIGGDHGQVTSSVRVECKGCSRFLGLVPIVLVHVLRKRPTIARGLKFRCSRCKEFTSAASIK